MKTNLQSFSRALVLPAICSLAWVALPSWGAKSNIASDLVGNLYAMKSVYEATYAPAAWKQRFSNYDLEQEFQRALKAAQENPQLSLADSRKILKDFVYAMRDYHVSISFLSTETASLPFTVKGAEGKVFLVYIDRSKLPNDIFPFQIGDEVVSFGGKAVAAAISEVQSQFAENVELTDRATAEMRLTNRTAARGLSVPRGPITVSILPKGEKKARDIQLIWNYNSEKIDPRKVVAEKSPEPLMMREWNDGPLMMLANALGRSFDVPEEIVRASKSALFRPRMDVALDEKVMQENPYTLGTKRSYTPALGTKVWEAGDANYFDAYVYKTADRKLIGYVRIASYVTPDYMKAVGDFRRIIAHMEKTTDAMVIDQVNNPGGSVFYLYALVSMLSDQPMRTPRHRMALTQADVLEALETIEKLKDIKTDEEARKAMPIEENHGYPSSYEFVQFTLNYCRFLVSEWSAGRKLTEPYWIAGVDHINPDPTNYTKPILLLTNPLDFSGGDFFPAILQDNKRVTIMGTRTAGAGGYVSNVSFPNALGVNAFRVTMSLAERVDGNPIENLGVTPDIPYELSAKDLSGGYRPYVEAIQKAVTSLIQ